MIMSNSTGTEFEQVLIHHKALFMKKKKKRKKKKKKIPYMIYSIGQCNCNARCKNMVKYGLLLRVARRQCD